MGVYNVTLCVCRNFDRFRKILPKIKTKINMRKKKRLLNKKE